MHQSKLNKLTILALIVACSEAFSTPPSIRCRYSCTALSYSNGIDSGYMESYANKRDKGNQEEDNNGNKKKRRGGEVQRVLTMDDFTSAVIEEKEKITVVKFSAPWCRACKSIGPLYKKLVSKYGASNIKFVDAPMTSVNTEVHDVLEIRNIPFAHVYHPTQGLLEERKIGRKFISSFQQILRSYVEGSCAIDSKKGFSDPYVSNEK